MELEPLIGAVGGATEAVQLLVEDIPAAVAVLGRDGTIRSRNTAWVDLFGSAERVEDCKARAASAPPDARPTPLEQAATGARIDDEELECVRQDGASRAVRLSAVPLQNGGEPSTLVVMVDVSERRSLEAIRQQAIGVVAHDLRNPLSALRMTLSMLARPKDMPTERRVQLAERMLGTIGRMESLIASLLDSARAEAGVDLRLAREEVDLRAVLERVGKDLDVLFPGRTLDVQVAGQPVGRWDRSRIERVLANLLTNALKHGSDEGPVTVTIDGLDPAVVVMTVRNRGAPIAPELLPQIFEPFTVGPLGPEGRRRTIGLGLFIVHHIVTAHGGSVAVQSTAEEGTVFTVRLPR